MPKQRRGEHGPIVGGRIKLERTTREVIRTYTRYKLMQARAAFGEASRRHERVMSTGTLSAMQLAGEIMTYLESIYHTGQNSVDPALWAECRRIVTTDERHTDPAGTETRTIPGME